jgi:DNA-binding IclR family transcriptional regulator
LATPNENDLDRLPPIQSVQRAAGILDLFTSARPRWTLAEITKELAASRATAHRYLVALRRTALLRYDEAAGIYTLGPEVLRLGAAALAGLPVVEIARPFMNDLAQRTGETVALSVWDGEGPVIVRAEHVAGRIVQIHIQTGARVPAKTSAQGRVFLTYLGQADEPGGDEEVRRTGVAFSSRIEPGIRAVSAPVFNGDGIAAVITLVGTEASVPEDPQSLQAVALRDTAKQISEAIGSPKNRDE